MYAARHLADQERQAPTLGAAAAMDTALDNFLVSVADAVHYKQGEVDVRIGRFSVSAGVRPPSSSPSSFQHSPRPAEGESCRPHAPAASS